MSAADNSAVVQASKNRQAARETLMVQVIRDRYIVERIMRLARQKALHADAWSLEVRLGWATHRALLQGQGLKKFTEGYLKLELERRGFDLPVKLHVIHGSGTPFQFPFRPFVQVFPATSR